LPQVRLNKDRNRAVCTRIDCGEPFADVVAGVPDDATIHLEFLGGWKPSGDGVMRMDGRAPRSKAILRVREGGGGGYWWEECSMCECGWQVAHFVEEAS
jgi:hypothetical protein